MADNYYKLKQYVSNSDLNALRVALGWKIQFKGDKQQAYDFGNLLDALITEPELVDAENRSVELADGTTAIFDITTWARAQEMRAAALHHPTLRVILPRMKFQVVVLAPDFRIDTPTASFYMPARIKMDGCSEALSTGLDLKSTAAQTQKAFEQSLYTFDYDQQCAWYMDVKGLDRFWFAGVGKKALRNGTYPVFPYAVQRGDAFYLSGKQKYQDIAEQYHRLILGLDYHLVINKNIYYESQAETTEAPYGYLHTQADSPTVGLDATPWDI